LAKAKVDEKVRMVDIYILGKHYEVPEGLTIQTALEYCGYNLIRGVGCRAGFCGACGTVYCSKDDYTLKYALACQKAVEQDMYITQIPFFPAPEARYSTETLEPEEARNKILELYPQTLTCFGCNNCTKSCPQDIKVMEAMACAIRGDYEKVAELAFDCVMCGLCAARCPQGLQPYNVFLAARRISGIYLAAKSQHNLDRVKEINKGKFDEEIKSLKRKSQAELRKLYAERVIEPEK
jgi:ferredoxin